MRITQWMTQQRRLTELRQNEARLEEAQSRVSTGVRLQRPSDNPGATAQLLRINTRIAEREQRRAAAAETLPLMRASESALGQIATALQSARMAGLQAANAATVAPEQRAALAAQVRQALQQVTALANTRVDSRYVFAGTLTDTAPFSTDGAATYAGNDASLVAGVAGDRPFAVSVTGEALRRSGEGTDLFANLESLAQAIERGEMAAQNEARARVEADWSRTLQLRGDMGARIGYVEMAAQRLDDELGALRERQAGLRDADLAEAVIETKTAENARQATLAMVGSLDRVSLLDYLR